MVALLPETQQRSEVRVCRNPYSPFAKGRVKDDLICDALQPSGAKMDGVMPGGLKDARDCRRERALSIRNFIRSTAMGSLAHELRRLRSGGPG